MIPRAVVVPQWREPVRALPLVVTAWPLRTRLSRAGEALLDVVLLLGLIVSVPVAILLVGAPIALAGKLLIWLVERL